MDSKSIFLSKTLWLNAVGLALMFVNMYAGTLDKDVLPIVLGVLNILNRFLTDKPVHLLK